jgi:glycosyltransferase involved in cell wall biosynthesis
VYPPVDTAFYRPALVTPESHFLIVSALVPYKRVELAIEACQRVGARLRIVGDGPERPRLERLAGAAVTFLGPMVGESLRDEYRRAQAIIMPGEEDFGIVPVEAQACGRPVVAYGRGGALETVVDGDTGVFFAELTSESLGAALQRVSSLRFEPERLHAHADQFSRDRHIQRMRETIDETLGAPAGTTW